jgi:N-methylhydantoinase A
MEAGLYDRAALDPGAMFQGPAIVTQADCTILVPGGWAASVDGLGNIVMEHG